MIASSSRYKSFIFSAFKFNKVKILQEDITQSMYAGSYEMPNCNACGRQVRPGELSESFSCPKCRNATIWRCEGCKGKQKKYQCSACGYKGR
ncbi:MAG: zinc finger domain-containing protein [Nitrososphaera sp.]